MIQKLSNSMRIGIQGRALRTPRPFILPVLSLILIIAVACGGDEANVIPPTAVPSAPESTPASAAGEARTAAAQPAQRVSLPSETLTVVTTSNIVSDWVRAVGQNRVESFPLLPPNTDPHTYQPGARDITRIADADLIFSVGLSLEGVWLDELIENAARDHYAIVPLGEVVDPIDFVETFNEHDEEDEEGEEGMDHGDEEEDEHGHGELDPHFWFDPLRVKQAVNSIAAHLSTHDPDGQTLYRDNAAAYNEQLDDLHAWITQQVAALPENRRVLVTSHDSFQYFAKRYGFEVAGAIFPVTTEAEPTAQDLADLIEVIEHEEVPAVFTETSHSERLARRVAEETGAVLIGGLYTGSLGTEGEEAGTYIELMRHNTTTIVEALK